MGTDSLVINGHFKTQQITGVQRYALELIHQFKDLNAEFSTIEPPQNLQSDSLRQLWMQIIMPAKIPSGTVLWSPTNIGPAFVKNQVLTLHDIADQLHPEWFDPKYVYWRKSILPFLLKNVKGIITVSEYSKRTIIEKYPYTSGKIEVIYNGVRINHFYPRPADEVSEVKRRFNLDKPFMVTVGSLDPRKNINGLIQAWDTLPADISREFQLVIVGARSDKFNFKLEEGLTPNIRFLGYVDYDILPALYSASRFFIYPSLFEGFGLPVLEAMACKTPVITSNTTSLGELASGYSMMIDPTDREQISEAIKQYFTSKQIRNAFVSEAYNYAKSYTWQKSAQKTLDFLGK